LQFFTYPAGWKLKDVSRIGKKIIVDKKMNLKLKSKTRKIGTKRK
jgi:hypothetical protein